MKDFFNFDFSNFKGDLFGGITAGIVALPLALAFGVSSGLGPSAGLYGAIFISFFAAMFGGTNTQISGPTAPMTAVSMVMIAGLIAVNDGDVNRALPAILTVFILAGIFQILLGFSGLGKYIKYIPYPVVSGFMTAIGLIILITQILPVIGYYADEDQAYIDSFKPLAQEHLLEDILQDEAGEGLLVLDHFEETIKRANKITEAQIQQEATSLARNSAGGVLGTIKILPRALKKIELLELLLALGTIIIIYGFKRITTAIPSTLVALVIMTGIAVGFDFEYDKIDAIPSGIPLPHLEVFTQFDFSLIAPYIFTAITLALLGGIDSLLTSVVADNMTKTKHNPNKELVGQGVGNGIAGLFGGIPGAGATIRTVVNINAGGKTRLSGMMAGVLLLLVLLALGPIASTIPAAVLAGILVTVGIGVMDYKGLKAIPHMPSGEVVVMIVVMILSSIWNLVYAVGIGLIISALIFMKKMGDLTASESTITSTNEEPIWDDEKDISTAIKEQIFIKHVNGPLFFGSTSEFQQLAKQVPETAKILVIRLEKMKYLDQSGLYAMEDVLADFAQTNIKICIVGLHKQPKFLMQKIDLIPDIVANELIFETMETCKDWIKKSI
ncbi:SulP family inorganic anion transporter [Urechidicola sp. KH5]